MNRIIIAYDFKENGYYISDTELESYEYKEFLLNTLHSYNSKTLFKFDSLYKPMALKIFFLFLSSIFARC